MALSGPWIREEKFRKISTFSLSRGNRRQTWGVGRKEAEMAGRNGTEYQKKEHFTKQDL